MKHWKFIEFVSEQGAEIPSFSFISRGVQYCSVLRNSERVAKKEAFDLMLNVYVIFDKLAKQFYKHDVRICSEQIQLGCL
jgi:ABC-type xylose transport system substrate-binding protein